MNPNYVNNSFGFPLQHVPKRVWHLWVMKKLKFLLVGGGEGVVMEHPLYVPSKVAHYSLLVHQETIMSNRCWQWVYLSRVYQPLRACTVSQYWIQSTFIILMTQIVVIETNTPDDQLLIQVDCLCNVIIWSNFSISCVFYVLKLLIFHIT